MAVPFEHRKMPVERKHKFRRNTMSGQSVITFPLLRTEQDTEQNTRKSVHKFFPKLFGHDKANGTRERLIY